MYKKIRYLHKSFIWSLVGLAGWVALWVIRHFSDDGWYEVSLLLFVYPIAVVGVFMGLLYGIAAIPQLKRAFGSFSKKQQGIVLLPFVIILVNLLATVPTMLAIVLANT